jgi:hypothetical protein
MICPRCSSNQTDEVKFCTVCGANLQAVRQVLDSPQTDDRFNWNNTWLAEMFMSAEEQKRRKAALELARGVTPEIKRYNEIKAGVITSSIGIALSIFLFVFMSGVAASSKVSADAAGIISNLWIAGVIPFFVGVALMVNGLVVSKKLVEIARREKNQQELESGPTPASLRPANTNEFLSTPFSVTEQTTQHLKTSDKKESNKG